MLNVGYLTTYFSKFYKGPMYYQLESLSRHVGITTFTSNEESYQYFSSREKVKDMAETFNVNWNIKRFDILFKIRGFVYPKNLKEILQKEKLDVIHSNEYYQPISWHGLMVAKKNKLPFILNQRRPEIEFSYKLPFMLFNRFCKDVVYQSDKIICISTQGKNLLLQLFPRLKQDRLSIIPNGIDLRRFKKLNPDNFRRKYNIPNKFVIMNVGRIFSMKRIDLLVRIFSDVKKHIDAVLVIVGPESEIEGRKVRKLIKQLNLDDVILTGPIRNDEIPDAIASCDVFALTSEKEPFGYVLLEAMACKKPCIAFNVGGVSDIIKNNENGFLVDFGNISEFAEKIVELANDKNKITGMGANGCSIVEKEFSLDITTKKLLDIYNFL